MKDSVKRYVDAYRRTRRAVARELQAFCALSPEEERAADAILTGTASNGEDITVVLTPQRAAQP